MLALVWSRTLVDAERLVERGADPARPRRGALGSSTSAGQHQGELVAAEAGDDVGAAQHLLQAVGRAR